MRIDALCGLRARTEWRIRSLAGAADAAFKGQASDAIAKACDGIQRRWVCGEHGALEHPFQTLLSI